MAQIVQGGGRPAVSAVRDGDWETLVKLVHDLPNRAKQDGLTEAWVYADTQLRSIIDAVGLARINSRARAKALTKVHAMLSEGSFGVMALDNAAGLRCRGAFLRVIERLLVAPTMRSAFERSISEDRGYKPEIMEE